MTVNAGVAVARSQQLRPLETPSALGSSACARAIFVAGLLTAASLVAFAWFARFPVPYRDDWDWLLWLFRGPKTLARFFEPHNEHMIPLPRLLMWLQYRLQGANGTLLCWVALASQATVAAIFVKEVRQRWADAESRDTLVGVTLLAVCFAYQLQSLVFVAAALFPLVQALSAVAILCGVSASDPQAGQRRGPWLAASVVMTAGAMLTTSNGLLVPFILALVVALRRSHPLVTGVYVALGTCGAVLFASTVLGTSAARASGAIAPSEHVAAVVQYFLAFFVPFLTYGSPAIGAIGGGLGLLAGVLLCFRTALQPARTPRLDWIACALMLFVVGSAGMAAVGRAQFGVDQAAQSRYATFALVYWAALVAAAASWLEQRTGEALRIPRAAQVPVLAVVGLVLVAHLVIGVVWLAKTGNVRAAGLALSAGVQDEEWLKTLHPITSAIHEAMRLTRADGDRTIIDPRIGTKLSMAEGITGCTGALTLGPVAPTAFLRLSGHIEDTANRGLVIDATGTVVGLAEPAPLLATPDPPRTAFTAAVRQAMLQGRRRIAGGWIGFVQPSPSLPLTFVAMDGTEQPVCRIDLAVR